MWTVCCVLFTLPASADVTLTYKPQGNASQAFEIAIKPPMMRMNEAGGTWMLYDRSLDTMFAVDPNQKSYTRINRDRAAMMGGMMNAAQAQMKEMMKNMTPEQRAMMEQAMGRPMPEDAPKSTYKDTGKTRTVDRRKCKVGQLLVNDKMEHEFCVATPKAVGVSPEDYAVMTSMFELMSALREAAGSYFNRTIPDPKDLQGIAIESRSINGDHLLLHDVSHKKLDAAHFRLPGDYQEAAIPKAPPSFN